MRLTNTDELVAAIAELPLAFERMGAELRVGLQAFHNGVPLQGARCVQVGATGSTTLAWAGPGRLVGWSLRAVGGPVSVVIRDSRTSSGDILAVIELTENQAETRWLGASGVSFVEGVYVQAVAPGAGVIQGAVYLGAVD